MWFYFLLINRNGLQKYLSVHLGVGWGVLPLHPSPEKLIIFDQIIIRKLIILLGEGRVSRHDGSSSRASSNDLLSYWRSGRDIWIPKRDMCPIICCLFSYRLFFGGFKEFNLYLAICCQLFWDSPIHQTLDMWSFAIKEKIEFINPKRIGGLPRCRIRSPKLFIIHLIYFPFLGVEEEYGIPQEHWIVELNQWLWRWLVFFVLCLGGAGVCIFFSLQKLIFL